MRKLILLFLILLWMLLFASCAQEKREWNRGASDASDSLTKVEKELDGKQKASPVPQTTERSTSMPHSTEEPTATPAPTEIPTATPTPTVVPTATPTTEPTPTSAPTATPIPTAEPTAKPDTTPIPESNPSNQGTGGEPTATPKTFILNDYDSLDEFFDDVFDW